MKWALVSFVVAPALAAPACNIGSLTDSLAAPDPTQYGGSMYLSLLSDPSTTRNKKINKNYYHKDKLDEFKKSSFYQDHRKDKTDDSGDDSSPANNTFVEFFTGGRQIVAAHSHNDYTRDTPLFDAIQRGLVSVEADVWFDSSDCGYTDDSLEQAAINGDVDLSNDQVPVYQLMVGHKEKDIKAPKTFQSMYLSPLMTLLDQINGYYGIPENSSASDKAGVFFDYPKQPLNVLVDFKKSGYPTFVLLMKDLQTFIERNYLTYYDFEAQKIVSGPLKIIVSGKEPIDALIEEDKDHIENKKGKRFVFVDSDMNNITDSLNNLGGYSSVESSDLANLDLILRRSATSDKTKNQIQTKFNASQELGMKTRVWGQGGSDNKRIYINKLLLQIGLDILNLDDLDEISEYSIDISS